ncbi:hypothetical protein [Gottfriedia acidiceleris]|uniref:NADH dehydrogenase subunit 6 n=1 Tax=Gottfriedia acidiceleris TaxID=371036 RepID=A0ABY4JQT4_9BACI|nr:hypothetical protein [Gottfriedia acidiceleris]UPM55037.1 hypothetical protein MY490_04105 [Gottfriedia acidiceleris]
MKKILLFSISFILLFVALNVFSGMLLTVFYQPDLADQWSNISKLPHEVIFVESSSVSLFIVTMLSVFIAFVIQNRFTKLIK